MVKANRNGTVRSNDRTTGPGESSTLPKPYGRCNRRSVGVARKDHGTVVRNARQEAHARSTDRGIGHCTSDGSLGHSSGDRRGNPPPTGQGIIVRRLPIPITDNENGLRRGVNLRKDVVHPRQVRLLSVAIHRHHRESSSGKGHGSMHRSMGNMRGERNGAGTAKHRPPQDGGTAVASGETARTKSRRRGRKGGMPPGIKGSTASPRSIADMPSFLQTNHTSTLDTSELEDLRKTSSSKLSDLNRHDREWSSRRRGMRQRPRGATRVCTTEKRVEQQGKGKLT